MSLISLYTKPYQTSCTPALMMLRVDEDDADALVDVEDATSPATKNAMESSQHYALSALSRIMDKCQEAELRCGIK